MNGSAPDGGLAAHVVVERGAWRLDVGVDAAPGETVALLGPNAAGKTTTLRAIAGLLPIDAGRIVLSGREMDEPERRVWVPPERRDIGMVFQDYLLFPNLSALDNVAFGLRERGVPRREARARAAQWLARVGLDDAAALRPHRLSGGQAQRVALARALATEPALLLLDEPLAALDAGTRATVRADLRRHLEAFGGPSLVVTHDPVDAAVLADRVIVVEAGRVAQAGAPEELSRRPATAYVADLMGLNLWRGDALAGAVSLAGGGTWWITDRSLSGPVCLAVRPQAVSLHHARPEGSPRNVWPGVVTAVERRGDLVRVSVDAEPPVTALVSPSAASDLGLVRGTGVWCSVKATEVEAYPA